jgi:hypothetical protein
MTQNKAKFYSNRTTEEVKEFIEELDRMRKELNKYLSPEFIYGPVYLEDYEGDIEITLWCNSWEEDEQVLPKEQWIDRTRLLADKWLSDNVVDYSYTTRIRNVDDGYYDDIRLQIEFYDL